MSTRGKISELFDVAALQQQQKQVVGLVDEFVRKAANVKSIKVNLEGAEKTSQVVKGVTELGLATKEYQRIVDATAVAQAKYNALQSDAAKVQAAAKIAVTEQNKAINEEIRLNTAAQGSINQKRIQLTQLQRQYDALGAAERDNASGKELLTSIDALDAELKKLEGSTGRFQRNVGNYSGALQTLKTALDDIKKKMDDMTNSGQKNDDVVKQLQKEYDLLDRLVNSQANGFASATQELKNNEKALQALGAAGLESTEFYHQLLAETAKLKDNVGDLKAEIKNLASDTHTLDGLIGAAQTLAGAYGIAQGAAALFGNEDKELQKTFVKLQAVLTILNGLQAIQNALQKESSVRLLITNGLQKIQTLQTTLQAGAESELVIVRYAAIAAQRALNAVMTVAGGPIGIVIGALALLVISLKAFASSNESAIKSLQAFNLELDVTKSFLDEELNAIKNSNKEREAALRSRFATEQDVRNQTIIGQQREIESLKNYEQQNANAYDAALSTFKKFHRNKKSVDEDTLKEAIAVIDKYESINRDRLNKESELNVALLENQRAATAEGAAVERNELQVKIENVNLRADLAKRIASDEFKSYDERRKALVDFYSFQQQANSLAKKQALDNPELKKSEKDLIIAQNNAKAIQLKRDQTQELVNIDRAERERKRQSDFDFSKDVIQAAANNSQAILSNEHKNYADRITAANGYYLSQKALIETQRDFDLGSEKLNADEKKNIKKKANDDLIKLQIDFGQQINDLVVAQLDKEQQDRLNSNNKERDESIKGLNDRYNAGKIGLADYNRERLELERGYSLESLQISIDETEKTIALYKSLGYDVGAEEAKLAALQMQLSDEVTNKKITDLKKLKDFEKQIGQEVYDTAVSLVDGTYERQKNAIQDQIDDLDKKKEKDIEVANTTITNEQDKANAVSVINARANSEKEALQRRQKQADIDKAKFDKAANIANIAITTGSAIINQLKETPLPKGAAFVAAIASIGALQLARAIATPIPKYRFGKSASDNYEGMAMVDDGGKPEAIIRQSGQVEIGGSQPRYTWVGKHDIVHPDAGQYLKTVVAGTHERNLAHTRYQGGGESMEVLIERAMEKHSHKIVSAILNKKEISWHMRNGEWQATIRRGTEISNYINDNIRF